MQTGDHVRIVKLIYPGPSHCIGRTGRIIGPIGTKICDVIMDDTDEVSFFDHTQELELVKESGNGVTSAEGK